MAYTNDSASDISKIRALIYDITDVAVPVRGTDYWFEDAEIEDIAEQNSDDLYGAAADLARSLALKFAQDATEINLGKEDIQIIWKRSQFYTEIAKQYEAKSVGGSPTEYVDSANIFYSGNGVDGSEYIGDD